MSKIIEALKALYVKLGGTASTVADVTQTPDMINAIAGLDIGGGGTIADNSVTTSKIADGNVTEAKLESDLAAKVNATELPSVTSEDNGSVLLVDNGAWGKGSVPAPASNDFVVTYTMTEDEQTQETVITADKTLAEITTAIEAGKFVRAIVESDESSSFMLLVSAYGSNITFVTFYELTYVTLGHTESGIQFSTRTLATAQS